MSVGNRLARLVPGPIALVFLTWILIALQVYQPFILSGDGDPARHIRHGLWILEHRSVIHNDPFSFTRFGEPFVGFEYGSQVLFGLAHRIAGLAGVSALAVLLIALTPALVTWFLLRRGVHPGLSILGGFLAGVLGQTHFLARPHLMTFLLTIVLLDWLERRRRPPWWAFGLLFALWTNLHGGVVFGLSLVGMYLFAAVLEAIPSGERATHLEEVKSLGAIFAVGLVSLFLTPYGAAVPLHLTGFFGAPYLRDHTAEFQSPDFHWVLMKPFLACLLGVLVTLAWSRRRLATRWLAVIASVTAFALIAQRNVTLWGITVVPIMMLYVQESLRAESQREPGGGGFANGGLRARNDLWVLGGCLAILLIGLHGGRIGGRQVLDNRFDEKIFPVSLFRGLGVEGTSGRMFHDFTWGGWLLYESPARKVFIDGGTDFYGADLFRAYGAVKEMAPGWRDTLEAYGVDRALLKVEDPVAHELARDPQWRMQACDGVGAYLARDGTSPGLPYDSLTGCLHGRYAGGSRPIP